VSHLFPITFPHVKHRTGMIIARAFARRARAVDGRDASRSAIAKFCGATRIAARACESRSSVTAMRDAAAPSRVGDAPTRDALAATRVHARARPLTKILRLELIARLERGTRAVDDAFARVERGLGRLLDAASSAK